MFFIPMWVLLSIFNREKLLCGNISKLSQISELGSEKVNDFLKVTQWKGKIWTLFGLMSVFFSPCPANSHVIACEATPLPAPLLSQDMSAQVALSKLLHEAFTFLLDL